MGNKGGNAVTCVVCSGALLRWLALVLDMQARYGDWGCVWKFVRWVCRWGVCSACGDAHVVYLAAEKCRSLAASHLFYTWHTIGVLFAHEKH
ncbi:hypothetical protein IWX49DRAFT_569396 [Phyllosticta citricarpa]